MSSLQSLNPPNEIDIPLAHKDPHKTFQDAAPHHALIFACRPTVSPLNGHTPSGWARFSDDFFLELHSDQMLPRILAMWLDLGVKVLIPPDSPEFSDRLLEWRIRQILDQAKELRIGQVQFDKAECVKAGVKIITLGLDLFGKGFCQPQLFSLVRIF